MMITRGAMFKVFLSSFFIQSSWSFEKMQGLGFAAAIQPALKEIFKDKEERNPAFKRHLVFYNSHPYMASPVLGACIRLEEKAKAGECGVEAGVDFKNRVMGPYGALGDLFFWGSVRPLASILGVLAALLWGIWGPIVFLIVYNFFHLRMRWYGLEKGYSLGAGVVGYVKSLELPDRAIMFRYVSSGVLGVLCALAVFKMSSFSPAWRAHWAAAFVLPVIGAVISLNRVFQKGITVSRLIYIVVPPLILLGVIY